MSKIVTNKTFIEKAKNIHGNLYSYELTSYVGRFKKTKIICNKHGIFEQTPDNHLSGKGCPECGGRLKLTKEKFIKRSNKIHEKKYDYNKVIYVNNHTKVDINVSCMEFFHKYP